MLKDVFVQACGPGVFPGVGFTVMGSGCLCRRLVMARGGLASELLLAAGRHCWPLGGPAEMYTATDTRWRWWCRLCFRVKPKSDNVMLTQV